MKPSGQLAVERRANNAKALAAFGVNCGQSVAESHFRTVREGCDVAIFTVGYEKRDGDELISLLREAGVNVLVDVRQRAMSRKPDFRANSLLALCRRAGISYQQMPELGSIETERIKLRETGDIKTFLRRYRAYAKKKLAGPLDSLAELVKDTSVALLCYERSHEDCHRSVIAEFVADRLNSRIVAVV